MEYLIVFSVVAMMTMYVWILPAAAARVTALEARTRTLWAVSVPGDAESFAMINK